METPTRPAKRRAYATPWPVPVVCRQAPSKYDKRVLLTRNVDVMERGELRAEIAGAVVTLANWQADALIRDRYAVPA